MAGRRSDQLLEHVRKGERKGRESEKWPERRKSGQSGWCNVGSKELSDARVPTCCVAKLVYVGSKEGWPSLGDTSPENPSKLPWAVVANSRAEQWKTKEERRAHTHREEV